MSFLHHSRRSDIEQRGGGLSLVEMAIIVAAVLAACLAGIASGSFTSV